MLICFFLHFRFKEIANANSYPERLQGVDVEIPEMANNWMYAATGGIFLRAASVFFMKESSTRNTINMLARIVTISGIIGLLVFAWNAAPITSYEVAVALSLMSMTAGFRVLNFFLEVTTYITIPGPPQFWGGDLISDHIPPEVMKCCTGMENSAAFAPMLCIIVLYIHFRQKMLWASGKTDTLVPEWSEQAMVVTAGTIIFQQLLLFFKYAGCLTSNFWFLQLKRIAVVAQAVGACIVVMTVFSL